MSGSRLLIVFVKNKVEGKVKTRLAETVGVEKALEIYQKLLDYTFSVAKPVESDKEIRYSRFIPNESAVDADGYYKKLQEGSDLGERMSRTFRDAFEGNYKKAVLIGSDCAELSTDILEEAYHKLEEHDLVIGPARDGGYYLIGMKQYYPAIFENISWSTDKVLDQTLFAADKLNLNTALLPELNDVDYEADWIQVKDRL